MSMFRIAVAVLWLAIVWITFLAISQQGMAAGEMFVSDIRNLGWRAQFNVDFLAHLVLMGLWVAWRHRFSAVGCVIGAACVLGGGLVSLVYLLVISFHCRGDVRLMLLGRHALK